VTKSKGIQRKWTEAEDNALKEGFAGMLTMLEISMKMPGRSRIACQTRADRLGLKRARPPMKRHSQRGEIKLKRTAPMSYNRPPEALIAYGIPKTMLELKERDCRWPVDGKYCSAEKVKGFPYCPDHVRCAYQRAK